MYVMIKTLLIKNHLNRKHKTKTCLHDAIGSLPDSAGTVLFHNRCGPGPGESFRL